MCKHFGNRFFCLCNRFFFFHLCLFFCFQIFTYFAENNLACTGCFARKNIIFFFRHLFFQICIHDRNDAARFIPAIQRLFVQNIKKFIHIKNAGRLNQNPVISTHSHGDQFCFESSAMCFRITSTGDHFQLALIAHQILKHHHIYIDCTKIILQNTNIFSTVHQIFCIFSYKGCLSCTKKSGDQIYFYHFIIYPPYPYHLFKHVGIYKLISAMRN